MATITPRLKLQRSQIGQDLDSWGADLQANIDFSDANIFSRSGQDMNGDPLTDNTITTVVTIDTPNDGWDLVLENQTGANFNGLRFQTSAGALNAGVSAFSDGRIGMVKYDTTSGAQQAGVRVTDDDVELIGSSLDPAPVAGGSVMTRQRADDRYAQATLVFPIGSIMMYASEAIDPNTFLPGTWTRRQSGRVIAESTGARPAGTEYGADEVTLTADQIPAHTHGVGTLGGTTNQAGSHVHPVVTSSASSVGDTQSDNLRRALPSSPLTLNNPMNAAGAHTHSLTLTGATGAAGGGQPHPNVPAAITFAVWERTA